MTAFNGLYKVFHTLVPRGGAHLTGADAARFASASVGFSGIVADLCAQHSAFRFYTRTPRTEPQSPAQFRSNMNYSFEAAEVVAFDTFASAMGLRDTARALETDFLDKSSAWLVTREYVGVNGLPKGPLDTGRGIKVITTMKRRAGMSLGDFRKHWEDHVRYVAATQGICRFTANAVVDSEYEVAEPPVDGFVEVWFRTLDDMQACFSDPLMTGVQQTHNDLFIDRRTFFTIQCRNAEQWVSGRRADGLREW